MKILAIESSAKAASVAVCEDGHLCAQYWQNTGLNHSKTLLRMTEGLLSDGGFRLADMDEIAVAKGPGSFTGVRIGVAAAKGLAWAAEKPVCGVSSLEAMVWPLRDMENAVICPVMDARLQQVYNARFTFSGGSLTCVTPDRAVSIAVLGEDIRKDGRPHILVGDGARLCLRALQGCEGLISLAPEQNLFQSAFGVALAATVGTAEHPDTLTPNYLRLSQAERERLARQQTEAGL